MLRGAALLLVKIILRKLTPDCTAHPAQGRRRRRTPRVPTLLGPGRVVAMDKQTQPVPGGPALPMHASRRDPASGGATPRPPFEAQASLPSLTHLLTRWKMKHTLPTACSTRDAGALGKVKQTDDSVQTTEGDGPGPGPCHPKAQPLQVGARGLFQGQPGTLSPTDGQPGARAEAWAAQP